jgi:hypothetical protein
MLEGTLHTNDVKVILANMMCVLLFSMAEINQMLQAVLFTATIVYTIVRIIHEIKKINSNGKGNQGDKE